MVPVLVRKPSACSGEILRGLKRRVLITMPDQYRLAGLNYFMCPKSAETAWVTSIYSFPDEYTEDPPTKYFERVRNMMMTGMLAMRAAAIMAPSSESFSSAKLTI